MNESAPYCWQRPQAWLYALDLARDQAWFLDLDREVLHRSAFLDERIATDVRKRHEIPIGELLAEPIRGAASAPAFLLHTAFCCSTLLARSLDLPGRSLVLREPAPLLELADLARGLAVSSREPAQLLPMTLDLLSRPFGAAEHVIVKPTNLVNNLATHIGTLRPGSRFLLLYDDLEAFLLAVLKRPRESERGIRQFLARFLADPAGRAWTAARRAVPQQLGECAALAWGLQIHSLQAWLAVETTARVRILRAEKLLADPVAAIEASANWFGLEMRKDEVQNVIAGPLWQRHAKYPAVAYTPERRREEQALARRLLAQPLAAALAWADAALEMRNANFPSFLRLLA
ncbi:MAG TPA: hypothetical protein VFX38_02745 [Gammaproteobacteria bacterium]|nr:hypothetical protein [Gammaproteobacteria bacterium]